jgi:hypothetical protein
MDELIDAYRYAERHVVNRQVIDISRSMNVRYGTRVLRRWSKRYRPLKHPKTVLSAVQDVEDAGGILHEAACARRN